MKIVEKEECVILQGEMEDVSGMANELTIHHNDFKEKNVIIDLLKHENLTPKEMLMFLELSSIHRQGKRSFVIANNALKIEDLPEELIVAPTLQEAEDIIKMEEVERELGF